MGRSPESSADLVMSETDELSLIIAQEGLVLAMIKSIFRGHKTEYCTS